jgi:hypothetical protein
MLTQQGVGVWGIVHGLGNPVTGMTADELLIQAEVCSSDIPFFKLV